MQYAEAFDEAKQRVNILDEARLYGLEVERGNFCRCAFHNERSASMKLYEETGTYYCFGCHATGTQIDLCMKLNGLSSPMDALRQLDSDFSLGLELDRPLSAEEKRRAEEARAERERRARVAEKLEKWRWQTASRYAGYIREANTLQKEPSTPREIALLRAREPLEYISDLLMSDDTETIIDLYMHREETERIWVQPLDME